MVTKDALWIVDSKWISRFAGGRVEKMKEVPSGSLKTGWVTPLGRDLGSG